MEFDESFFYPIIEELLDTNLFDKRKTDEIIVDRSSNIGQFPMNIIQAPVYATICCKATLYIDYRKDCENKSRKALKEIEKLIKIHEFKMLQTNLIQRTMNYTVRGFAREIEGLGIYDFDRIVVLKPYSSGSIVITFIGLEVAYKNAGAHRWIKQHKECYETNKERNKDVVGCSERG